MLELSELDNRQATWLLFYFLFFDTDSYFDIIFVIFLLLQANNLSYESRRQNPLVITHEVKITWGGINKNDKKMHLFG